MTSALLAAPSIAFEPRSGAEGDAHARAGRITWLRETAVVALGYLLNGLLLGLFAFTGTVPWTAGLVYAGPGLLLCGLAAGLVASGASDRFEDASLSWLHTLGSAALSLLGVALHPQLAFAYALILFIVMLTATYRMPPRQLRALFAVVVLLFAALTFGLGRRVSVPEAGAERWLAWLFFSFSLGRCVMLSIINTRNNRLLRERGIEMQAKLAEIERLAHHDELTGTLNRRRMLQHLEEELARHDRSGVPVSVALLDLDHFKAVNDTLGHGAGDTVLKRFAAAVQAHTRTTDRFGRYGGEEFLVILCGTGTEAALHAIARTRSATAGLDWRDLAPELRVTFSAGIATYNGSETAELLLSRADLGLYEAKRCGRNCSRAL
jgi:diguanylate cyclase (GGDEF)-like protein